MGSIARVEGKLGHLWGQRPESSAGKKQNVPLYAEHWNKQWDDFFKKYRNPSKRQILDKLDEMEGH